MQEQEWLDKNPFMQGWDFEIYSSPEQDSPFGGELFSMHLDLDLLGFFFLSLQHRILTIHLQRDMSNHFTPPLLLFLSPICCQLTEGKLRSQN